MTAQSMFVTSAAALVLLAPVLAAAPEVAEARPGAAGAAVAANDVVWDDSVYFGGTFMTDAGHRTVLVWGTPDGTMTMRRQADSSWTQPRVISTDPAVDLQVIAADAEGTITAVWFTYHQGLADGVMASRMTAGGGWSTPVHISRDLKVRKATELSLAVSAKGAAVVVWSSQGSNGRYRLQSVYRGAGRGWGTPVNVTAATQDHHPMVGIGSDGTARLLYVHHPLGHHRSLLFRSRHPGAGWTPATTVARVGCHQNLAVDRAGDVLVVFSPSAGGEVDAVYKPAGRGWGTTHRLSTQPLYSMAMNGQGTAVVALSHEGGRITLVRHPRHGPWSAPTSLSPPDGSGWNSVSVALNENGDTSVAWGEETLYGRYRPAGGRWSSLYTIGEDPGGVIEGVSSRVAPNGDAVVLWANENDAPRMRAMRTNP